MYALIPDYFTIAKDLKLNNVLNVYSKTYISRGIRFFQQQGRWIDLDQELSKYLVNGNGQIYQYHWMYFLYKNSAWMNTNFNAIVFRENSNMVLEIIKDINCGALIEAVFCDDILEADVINMVNLNTHRFIHCARDENKQPLDLSLRTKKNETAQSKQKIKSKKRQLLPCDICQKKFDRPSLLKRHIRTHTGERPHVCDVCAKGFSTSSSLNTHRRIHSGERPHQCSICGKRFTASSNLYYHRMTHSSEKPHKCDLCYKSFPTPGNLKTHRYSHEGSSPHKCLICQKAFAKQTNLRLHMQQHNYYKEVI